MGRWEPDAQGRLRRAALELYADRGFEETTVADIAAHAGVTERTFFRYFADKREVLFQGSAALEGAAVAVIEQAPASSGTFETVMSAVEALGELLADREYSRRRGAVIASHAGLRERELLKMASFRSAVSTALEARGATPTAAALAAESGAAAFRVGFEQWISSGETRDFAACAAATFAELRALTTPS